MRDENIFRATGRRRCAGFPSLVSIFAIIGPATAVAQAPTSEVQISTPYQADMRTMVLRGPNAWESEEAKQHRELREPFETFVEGTTHPELIPFWSKMDRFLERFSPSRYEFSAEDTETILTHRSAYLPDFAAMRTASITGGLCSEANQALCGDRIALFTEEARRYLAMCRQHHEIGHDRLVFGEIVAVMRERDEHAQSTEQAFVEYHASMLDALSPEGRDLLLSILDHQIALDLRWYHFDAVAFATSYLAEAAATLPQSCEVSIDYAWTRQISAPESGLPPIRVSIRSVRSTELRDSQAGESTQ